MFMDTFFYSVWSSLYCSPFDTASKLLRQRSLCNLFCTMLHVCHSLTKPLSTVMRFPLCWLIFTDCINTPSQCSPLPHTFAVSRYSPLSWQTLYPVQRQPTLNKLGNTAAHLFFFLGPCHQNKNVPDLEIWETHEWEQTHHSWGASTLISSISSQRLSLTADWWTVLPKIK